MKAGHRMGRNYLKGRAGVRTSDDLGTVGYILGLVLRWFAYILRALNWAPAEIVRPPPIA